MFFFNQNTMSRKFISSAILLTLSSSMHAVRADSLLESGGQLIGQISGLPLLPLSKQLTAQEKTAFTLLNSLMDIVSAKVDADSCNELRGAYPLKLFAVGVGGQRKENNMVTVQLPVHEVSVMGYPKIAVLDIGLIINTVYGKTSHYNDYDPVQLYRGNYNYNANGSLLQMSSDLILKKDKYSDSVSYDTTATTSFYPSVDSAPDKGYAANVGWGMAQLSDAKTPKSKYWQRFTANRDDEANGHVFFVRDLLASGIPCRVKIDISGHSGIDNISQEGFLTVEMASPGDPVGEDFNYTFDLE